MDPKSILSLLKLQSEDFEVDENIDERKDGNYIFVTMKDIKRVCPRCGGIHVIKNDHRFQTIKYVNFIDTDKPTYLKIYKTKYLCKDCGYKFYQQCNLVNPGKRISNELCWKVHDLSKNLISFALISKQLHVSLPLVLNVFDQIVRVNRKKLTRCISVDEKKFNNEYGKYVTIISNPENGDVLDVVQGRTNVMLDSYFSKISQKERDLVEFFTSDMYEGFRYVKNKYFPNAIHIIDHFHIKKLFTDKIHVSRCFYIREYKNQNDFIVMFLSKYWHYFNSDPNIKKKSKKKKRKNSFRLPNGKNYDFKTTVSYVLSNCPKLQRMRQYYLEFCDSLLKNGTLNETEETVDFLINYGLTSADKEMVTIAKTLREFRQEIINTFSLINRLKISNSVAEGNNTLIQKVIDVSYGMVDFTRFRKRILHIKNNKKIRRSN